MFGGDFSSLSGIGNGVLVRACWALGVCCRLCFSSAMVRAFSIEAFFAGVWRGVQGSCFFSSASRADLLR